MRGSKRSFFCVTKFVFSKATGMYLINIKYNSSSHYSTPHQPCQTTTTYKYPNKGKFVVENKISLNSKREFVENIEIGKFGRK